MGLVPMSLWIAISWISFFLATVFKSLCSLLEDTTIRVLRAGPIPAHIAFIMDGNRRFATQRHLAKPLGHAFGTLRFEQMLRWCFRLGIRTITVYAFSIENFRRPQDEVDTLMCLAIDKFRELAHDSLIHRHRVAIRVLGELEMLPEDVRRAAQDAMRATKDYHEYAVYRSSVVS